MRRVVDDAMDITGGAGICKGPRNMLAAPYMAVPIGITVEGANILTRTLIVFGQGAVRCHPWLRQILAAAENPANKEKLKATTDEAVARGVFGAPTFFVGPKESEEMHFGQDRLPYVEELLKA